MTHAENWRLKIEIALLVFLLFLLPMLFLFFLIFLYSESRIAGLWVSDIVGSAFMYGGLITYGVGRWIYSHVSGRLSNYPALNRAIQWLRRMNTFVFVICIVLNIFAIVYCIRLLVG